MIPRYKHLKEEEDQLKRSLRFQNLAVHNPKKITFPDKFVPKSPLDRRVMELIKLGELRKNNWRLPMIVTSKDYADRKGMLRVSTRMFDKYPEIVKNIMSHLIIVRAELHDFGAAVEYHAYSKMFDVVKDPGQLVPIYECSFELKDGKIVEWKIVKVGDEDSQKKS